MIGLSGRYRFRMIIPGYAHFNIYSRIASHTTALGPLCVATVVNYMPGWDVEVIDENNYHKLGPRGQDGRPDHTTLQTIRPADIVGLYGGLSSTIPRIHQLAAHYKKMGSTIIAGGQHFTGEHIQWALENGIDYVVIGEGEETIRELLETIMSQGDPAKVAGVAFMQNGNVIQGPTRLPITRFDAYPLPDFSLLRYSRLKLYPVGWIRGCGMNCEFCTVKGAPRSASPERVVAQIAALVESNHAHHFFIVDDLFGHNHSDTLKFCSMLRDYQKAIGARLNITVQIRLDRGRDSELLAAMRRAGITTVCIGFESPIAQELEAMDKRIRPEEMIELTTLFHRAGFIVHGMFIFGYPLANGSVLNISIEERIEQFRRFIRRGRLDTIQVLLPVPLPGTALTERLAAEDRIFPRSLIGWEYYDGNFPLFVPDTPLTPEEMHMALRKIMGKFYRFRNMFAIGLNVLIFPAMLFSLANVRWGWRRWYRIWHNALMRFSGWIIYHQWSLHFRRDDFSAKLAQAANHTPPHEERDSH